MSARHIWPVLYVGTVVGANLAAQRWGLVPVAPGIVAPAGVYFAGLALACRDAVHERHGGRTAAVLVLVGAGLSAVFSPRLALASALAFAVSELLDGQVWQRLRPRGAVLAVVGSGVVGSILDSLVFLALAFGSMRGLVGAVLGKLVATAVAAGVVVVRGRLS